MQVISSLFIKIEFFSTLLFEFRRNNRLDLVLTTPLQLDSTETSMIKHLFVISAATC